MQDLIGFFEQPSEPGDLGLQLSDHLHAAVLVDRGRVHYVFSPAGVAQSAQGLAVVHVSWRNGCHEERKAHIDEQWWKKQIRWLTSSPFI